MNLEELKKLDELCSGKEGEKKIKNTGLCISNNVIQVLGKNSPETYPIQPARPIWPIQSTYRI